MGSATSSKIERTTFSRRAAAELVLVLAVDGPRHRALYEALRDAIATRRLRGGEALPATRALAAALGLSRGVVVGVYEQLRSEGYVTARQGSGTVVSAELPDAAFAAPRAVATGAPTGPDLDLVRPRLSRWGRAAWSPFPVEAIGAPRPFRPHIPAVDAFPVEAWSALVARRARHDERAWLGAAPVRGSQALRRALVAHLATARAIATHEDAIVILPSVQQALDISARLLVDPGDAVWIEDPGYGGARAVFAAAGARIVPVPVDGRGILVDRGVRAAPRARLAYVTPGHQWPLGVTLAIERRAALLAWARSARAIVIEDDYDSEYRYEGRPVPALKSMDRDDVVLHVGAFSKTMLPSLRLAYAVVPERLLPAFLATKSLLDRHTPALLQEALADFLATGQFARHLRRMRVLYAERRRALFDALEAELGGSGLIEVEGSRAGLGFAVRTPRSDDERLVAALAARGVEAMALSPASIRAPGRRPSGLLLGFAPYAPSRLRRAARTLGEVLRGAGQHASGERRAGEAVRREERGPG